LHLHHRLPFNKDPRDLAFAIIPHTPIKIPGITREEWRQIAPDHNRQD
jgi:hypothetical protein